MKINYWIEAWALGMFMLSACFFVIVLESPDSPIPSIIQSEFVRRCLMGAAMGLTAISLIYSKWGKKSGALMNPALTLGFWYLGKISTRDAWAYSLSQTAGASLVMYTLSFILPAVIGHPSVNYVQTLPGMSGVFTAFVAEFFMSFGMLIMVLYASNHPSTASKTGIFAGILVMIYIIAGGPVSGMSINPARSFAAALAAHNFDQFWIYLIAPPLGMMSAAMIWKVWLCQDPAFECSLNKPSKTIG